MASSIFNTYSKDVYLNWHNQEVESGDSFEKYIGDFRSELKSKSSGKLAALAQLLIQIKQRTGPECKLQSKGMLSGEFELPIKHFSEHQSPEGYNLLFKSTDSIIECSGTLNLAT